MEKVNELLDMIGASLNSITENDIIQGKEIKLGKFTIVPLSSVHVGFGGGGGGSTVKGDGPIKQSNLSADAKGGGQGCGGGGCVRPVAVAVFSDTGVQVLEIPNPKQQGGVMTKLAEKFPDLVDKIKK